MIMSGSTSELEGQLLHMLEDMSDRVFARDISSVEKFWSGGRFWMFGSEAHEHDKTREELHLHMTRLFEKPYRVRFRFHELSTDGHGDMAWVNAMATLEVHHPDRVVNMPYRLFALFQNMAGHWHWRVFSGSEPASAPQ